MNCRHLYLWSLVLALTPLALTLGACAPSTANTSLPLRYLAPSDALFGTLVREAPRRHIAVNPYGGRFELIAANREAGVVSLAYDLKDIYGPARQTATFQLFDNQDGTVSVVTAAATTSRLGYPLMPKNSSGRCSRCSTRSISGCDDASAAQLISP